MSKNQIKERLKIVTVFGTRPEAIKLAMLVRLFKKQKDIKQIVCVTAQHREMLDQVLEFFQIVPNYDLEIMHHDQTLASLTALILNKITPVLIKEKPDLVFVHGDTTTCFATTLACFYLHIKVAHIEAGMRTFRLNAPFPEEANRLMATQLASYHFAPTKLNVKNLLRERIAPSKIIETGNTVIDALLFTRKKVRNCSNKIISDLIKNQKRLKKKIILVTGHRRENFGNGFDQICKALKKIAQNFDDIFILFPVHLNPKVNKSVFDSLDGVKNIFLCSPLSYPDFVFVMNHAWIILTDSGGIQEEAPSLRKPVLVMRDVTERPEAVKAGVVKIVGTSTEKIFSEVNALYKSEANYKKMCKNKNPYGDGKASERILNWVQKNRKNYFDTR